MFLAVHDRTLLATQLEKKCISQLIQFIQLPNGDLKVNYRRQTPVDISLPLSGNLNDFTGRLSLKSTLSTFSFPRVKAIRAPGLLIAQNTFKTIYLAQQLSNNMGFELDNIQLQL